MRRVNAVQTMIIMVLFLLHAILGGFQMLGVGNTALKTIAWVSVGLIAVHALIGVKLTVDTLKVRKATGVSYFKDNKLFWARRISGYALMVLIAFHLTAFSTTVEGATRLRYFSGARLAAQLLMVAAIAIHVISNVKPMMIALGIKSLRRWAGDILLVLSVLMLFMAAAFVVYYIRWNVL